MEAARAALERVKQASGRSLQATTHAREVQDALRKEPLPAQLLERLEGAYSLLRARNRPDPALVVRSSAVFEDSAHHSFSGVYHTSLGVTDFSGLVDAIRECWASAWSPEALAYCERMGYPVGDASMAVLVQVQMRGRVSGVIFTANPLTGNPFQICINAVPGAGEALVSGDASATEWILGRDGRVERASSGSADLLSEKELRALVDIANRVEDLMRGPQDVEWTLGQDGIFVLQARPITALPPYFPAPEEHSSRVWKLAFVGLFSPFGLSLESIKNPIYEDAIQRTLGRVVRHHQRVVHGYLYDRKVTPRWSWLLLPWSLYKHIRLLARIPSLDREYYRQLEPSYRTVIAKQVEGAERERHLPALCAGVDALVEAYLEFQRRSVAPGSLSNLFPRLVRRLVLASGLSEEPTEALDIFGGLANATLARDRTLAGFCQELTESGLARELAGSRDWDELRRRFSARADGHRFLERWDAFYRDFDYTWADGNPKDPGWREDPSTVLTVLRKMVETGSSRATIERLAFQTRRRHELLALWSRRLDPVRRALLRALVTYAWRYFPIREDHNHMFYRGVAAIRQVLLAIGKELVARGVLLQPEEVFFLRYEEVRDLAGVWDPSNLTRVVRDRREEFKRNRRLTPPYELGAKPAPRTASIAGEDGALRGNGASAGVARGPARVVLDPVRLPELRQGEILVCPKVRPYYTPFLAMAAGLVTDEGSLLSHGANLAREYGIPAVLGIHGATRHIRTGEVVVVDGSAGTVRILEAPAVGGRGA